MAIIVTRAGKGSPLLNSELDDNFTNLNTNKVELDGSAPVAITANSTNAAVRITQVGTGNALVVEDSANPDATPFVVSAAGLVGIGTLVPSSALDISSSLSGGTFASQIFSANNSVSAKTNYVKIDASVAFNPASQEAGGYKLQVLQNNAYKTIMDAGGALVNSTNFLAFGTTNEAMRIASNGTTSIGGTTGAESLRVTPVASSVNYVSVFGAVTGQTPTISPQGSDTNIPLGLSSKGTSALTFYTNAFGNIQFNIANTASAVNHLQVTGSATGNTPTISAQGSDANISLNYDAKGTGSHSFRSASGLNQFQIASTTSAVNYVKVLAAGSGSFPQFGAAGETNVGMLISGKGDKGVYLQTASTTQVLVSATASAVNYLNLTGAVTTGAPVISALGSDANISLTLTAKGTGKVISTTDATINGVTVGKGAGSLSNNTAVGSGSLNLNTTGNQNTGVGFNTLSFNRTGIFNTAVGTSAMTCNTVASSQTAVGYQALINATTAVATFGAITGGSGYTNGTYTAVAMTPVSGATFVTYPTVTVVVAGGAVTMVTLVTAGIIASSTDATILTVAAALIGGTGSGFSIPVATFVTGTNNTAIGYQTLVANTAGSSNTALGFQAGNTLISGNNNLILGNGAAVSTTTVSNEITLGNASITAFRIPGLSITAGASALTIGSQFAVTNTASAVNYINATGGVTGATPKLTSSTANIPVAIAGSNTWANFSNVSAAFGVETDITSAIGGHVVIGSVTGNSPYIGATNSSTSFNSGLRIVTNGVQQFLINHTASAVNYLQATGAVTTGAPVLSAAGSDTNIGITLTPKGTGVVTTAAFVGIGTTTPNTPLEVVKESASMVARGIATTSTAFVGALAHDYYSAPSFKGSYLFQYGSAAAGTTLGFAHANMGGLAFQNGGTQALIYTNGGTAIVFGTTSVDRGRVSSSGVWSFGAAPGSESLRVPPVANAVNYFNAQGSTTGNTPQLSVQGSDTNIQFAVSSKGTQTLNFFTNTWGQQQFQINHTASAVNFFTVTGNATGGGPALTVTGSDANISTNFITKGTGSHVFYTNNGSAPQLVVAHTASTVNYHQLTGSATGSAVVYSAQGSDTNIDLAINPKGTGNVRFGTLTANADAAVTGYITIKDSTGTVRKLAVID
jgi:hypothetical protein